MTDKRINRLPDEGDGLQEKADRIAALMYKYCLPPDLNNDESHFYLAVTAVHYASVIDLYCRQRDDQELKRISYHKIQGVRNDPNDVNPSTEAKIIERMNEPFYNFAVPIANVHVAYFDYILEKKIDELVEIKKTSLSLLKKMDDGDLPPELKDDLLTEILRNDIQTEQLDTLSHALSDAVNVDGEMSRIEEPDRRGRAVMATLLVDFAESCVAYRPDLEEVALLLTDKALLVHGPRLRSGLDKRLN